MNVWIVIKNHGDEVDIIGVFSSEQLANKFVGDTSNNYEIDIDSPMTIDNLC